MAQLTASAILQYGDAVYGRLTLPKKTAADALTIGDFLSWNTSGVERMDAVGEDATFIGICGMDSADADGPQNILVYTQCICEVASTSATYTPGQSLLWTDGEVATGAAANTVCWSLEYKTTATSLKVLVDTVALAKLFAILA